MCLRQGLDPRFSVSLITSQECSLTSAPPHAPHIATIRPPSEPSGGGAPCSLEGQNLSPCTFHSFPKPCPLKLHRTSQSAGPTTLEMALKVSLPFSQAAHPAPAGPCMGCIALAGPHSRPLQWPPACPAPQKGEDRVPHAQPRRGARWSFVQAAHPGIGVVGCADRHVSAWAHPPWRSPAQTLHKEEPYGRSSGHQGRSVCL